MDFIMRKYKLNSEMPWVLTHVESYPTNIPFIGLVEQDTCDPTIYPSVMFFIKEGPGKIRLLDFDPELQEEYLQYNSHEIVAWRLTTNHAGTFDKWIKTHPEDAFLKGV
jgi:hypothetical protein